MGFFSKIANAFKRTKTSIDNKLLAIMSKGDLDDEFFQELEMTLISADIGVLASEEIVSKLRALSKKQKIRSQEEVKIALRKIMSEMLQENGVPEQSFPLVLMIVGVNGVGKTTTIGKLARFYKDQGKSVLMVAGDTFRAAAGDQLTEWARRSDVKIVAKTTRAATRQVWFLTA